MKSFYIFDFGSLYVWMNLYEGYCMSKFYECMYVIKLNFLLIIVNFLFLWVFNFVFVLNYKNLKCFNMVLYGLKLFEKIKERLIYEGCFLWFYANIKFVCLIEFIVFKLNFKNRRTLMV